MFSNHPIFFVTKHPCCLERFGSAFQTHPEPTNPCWPQLAANSQEPSSSNEDALDSEANPAGLESGPGGILILPVGFLFSRWCVSWICVCVFFQFRRKIRNILEYTKMFFKIVVLHCFSSMIPKKKPQKRSSKNIAFWQWRLWKKFSGFHRMLP